MPTRLTKMTHQVRQAAARVRLVTEPNSSPVLIMPTTSLGIRKKTLDYIVLYSLYSSYAPQGKVDVHWLNAEVCM